jgi:hypothetical protein
MFTPVIPWKRASVASCRRRDCRFKCLFWRLQYKIYYCVINQRNRINLFMCYIHSQLYSAQIVWVSVKSLNFSAVNFFFFALLGRYVTYVRYMYFVSGNSDACLLALIRVSSFICWRFFSRNPKRRSFIFMLTRVSRWVLSSNRWTQSPSSYSVAVRSVFSAVLSKLSVLLRL